MSARRWWRWVSVAGLLVVVVLGTARLTRWPATWFDEGMHLHVPKALVQAGVYADRSSEGFRYFGPTLGVGPTVLLPIAASFAAFGVGLLQARVVMAAFLVAFVVLVYAFGRRLGGPIVGLLSAALVIATPAPSVIEYGRQVVGEVPAGMFLVWGLLLWRRAWHAPSWAGLIAAGVVLGLGTMTKHVVVLALGPAMLIAWGLDRAYYRHQPSRVFVVPGLVCALMFVTWQVAVLGWIPPGGFLENWRLLRDTSSGAAFVFDPAITRASLLELGGARAYVGLLIPALIYTGVRMLRRDPREQWWGIVWWITAANLAWFVVASAGWGRYAFIGTALSSMLVARLWRDVWRVAARAGRDARAARALRVVLATGLAGAIGLPLAATAWRIANAPPDHAGALTAWMNAHVSLDAIVETWEPELGTLSDHRYHYPPSALLIDAVAFKAGRGPAPIATYAFRDVVTADYVVSGAFGRWVGLYRERDLRADFEPVHSQGAYVVWRRTIAPADTDTDSTRRRP